MPLAMKRKKFSRRQEALCEVSVELVESITDSVTARTKLMGAVKNNDEEKVKLLLNNFPNLIADIYEGYNLPILYIACKDEVRFVNGSVIGILIDMGADLFYCCSKWSGMEAIHFATLGQKPEVLEVVIKKILEKNPEGINALSSRGETALHLLINYHTLNLNTMEKCVELLLVNGIDPNLTDELNAPPIYYSARNKFVNITKMLLNYGPDVCTYRDAFQRSALDYITEMKLYILNDSCRPIRDLQGRIYGSLKCGRYEEFVGLTAQVNLSQMEAYKTLLQLAVEKNLPNFTEYLLKSGCDPNQITRKNTKPPILIAAMKGHHEIFKLLLEHPSIAIGEKVLGELIKKIDSDSSVEASYLNCYQQLKSSEYLRSMQVNSCHTFIFDACKDLSFQEGALSNKKGLTILDFKYETLKNHFDECIEANSNIFEENQVITFNYKSLLPAGSKVTHLDSTQVVLYLSQSKQLKSLLTHPLISSFIFINWLFIKWLFYFNLIFFTVNCVGLFLYSLDFSDLFLRISSYFNLIMLFHIIPRKIKLLKKKKSNLEYILVTCTSFLVSHKLAPVDYQKPLCAFFLLYVVTKLLFLMGNFNNCSINIVMFKTVAWNYLKFLLMFSILLLAFSCSFHMLLKTQSNYFIDPYISVFKVIVMLSGEFEVGDIEFNQYPISSRIIFLGFVVIVSLTLLNLLNALAVSDTQEIKSEAELNRLIFRAKYIAATALYAKNMSFFNSPYIKECKRLFADRKGRILADCRKLGGDHRLLKRKFIESLIDVYLDDGIMEATKVILKARHDLDEKVRRKQRMMENSEIMNSKLNHIVELLSKSNVIKTEQF